MIYYSSKKMRPMPLQYQNSDRQFFIPFLLGGLAGGAAVGLTRPRPIYNVAPNTGFNPYLPSGSYSYSYYYPPNYPYNG